MLKLIFYFIFSTQLVFSQLGKLSIATKTLFDIYHQGTAEQIAVGLNDYLQRVLGLSFDSDTSVDRALSSYDFVWDINSVSQLLSGRPWDVYWAPEVTLETFSNPKDCTTQGEVPKVTRIGIFGQFNRGKTFILNAIAGLDLPTGEIRHTPGISVKRHGCDLTLLDSAGSSVPVEHNEEMLRDRQATDAFLQEILYTNSDIAIVVVNILTLEDQKFLDSVHSRMSKKQGGKMGKIFVVHNFKDIEIPQHVEIAIQHDIVSILKAYRSAATNKAVVYESKHFYHFIFARAGTEAADVYNENTAQAIKDIALGLKLFSHELGKFWDNLIESVNLRYLQFVEPAIEETEEAQEAQEEADTSCELGVDGATQCEQQPTTTTTQQQQSVVGKIVNSIFGSQSQQQEPQQQEPQPEPHRQQEQSTVVSAFKKAFKVVFDVVTGSANNAPKDTEKLKLTYTYPSQSIQLEEENDQQGKWTIGEIRATTDGKPLVPGDFILRRNLQFGCGALRWNFEDTFVPKHSVYITKDRHEALIVVEVGAIVGRLQYDFYGEKAILVGTHRGYEEEAEKKYEQTYSDITSGNFQSEFHVPFLIHTTKSTFKHDKERGLVIMKLVERKPIF